jgi:hypothetical protein
MSDYRIPKINEINTAGITNKNGVFYYNSRPLRVQTGLVLCPYGVSDAGKLRFQLSATGLSKLEKLDEMVNSLAEQQGIDHIKISTDGWLNLNVNTWTKFFDSNKSLINATDGVLTSEFTGSLLLDLSKITVFEDRMMLSITIMQVLVRTYNQLPNGCKIFTDIDELRLNLNLNKQKSTIPQEEAVATVSMEEEDNLNELLD